MHPWIWHRISLGSNVQYSNKGTTMAEIFDSIQLCHENGLKINVNVILGWNNLIEKDLEVLDYFMENLSENAMTSLQLRWLFSHPYTDVYEQYEAEEKSIKMGPFYCRFNVRVNDEQMKLNLAAAKIIKEKCDAKKIKLKRYKNLQKV
jgi:hypothetical protein